MVERYPKLFYCSLENLEARVCFLLNAVGVSKAKLGQVQNCSTIVVCN